MNVQKPTLNRKFESGLLFGSIDGAHMALLQVYSDYDVARRTLSDTFGRGHSEQVYNEMCTCWVIDTQKKSTRVLEDFFRPYSETVKKVPVITKLVLIPCTLDTPLLPNDFLD